MNIEFNTGGDEERRKYGVPMDGVRRWNTWETITAWTDLTGYTILCFDPGS